MTAEALEVAVTAVEREVDPVIEVRGRREPVLAVARLARPGESAGVRVLVTGLALLGEAEEGVLPPRGTEGGGSRRTAGSRRVTPSAPGYLSSHTL